MCQVCVIGPCPSRKAFTRSARTSARSTASPMPRENESRYFAPTSNFSPKLFRKSTYWAMTAASFMPDLPMRGPRLDGGRRCQPWRTRPDLGKPMSEVVANLFQRQPFRQQVGSAGMAQGVGAMMSKWKSETAEAFGNHRPNGTRGPEWLNWRRQC